MTNETRLKELDGWRAVSVLLVIVHHLGDFRYRTAVAPHKHLEEIFERCGPLGVKVFFVISGFVICRLLIQEERRYGSVSLKGFYIRRAFRILPPLYVYLAALCVLLSIGLIDESWRGIASSSFFLYDLAPFRLGQWFVGHTWSLAVEEQFYLLFPTSWVLLRRFGRRYAYLGAFCLIVVWGVLSTVFQWDRLMFSTVRDGFACISCGVLVANFESRARAIARAFPPLAVAAIAPTLFWHPENYLSLKSALYFSMYMPMAIALVLVFSLECNPKLRAFLCWKPVQAIGLTSYGVYLWQQLFTAPFRFYANSSTVITYLLPLLLVIIPASYLLIEKPAMRWGKSLSERLRRARESQEAVA